MIIRRAATAATGVSMAFMPLFSFDWLWGNDEDEFVVNRRVDYPKPDANAESDSDDESVDENGFMNSSVLLSMVRLRYRSLAASVVIKTDRQSRGRTQ